MLRVDEESQRLRRLYESAERELDELSRRRHPTPEEAIAIRILEKERLRLKDRLLHLGAALLTCACSGEITPAETVMSEKAERVASQSREGDALRGGRIYDRFYGENTALAFTPDDASTAALDGRGGPDGNGTLRDGLGRRLDNEAGHAYRMKNFFGWDLRGRDGIYGPEYQDVSYVAQINLIDDPLSRESLAALFTDGAEGIPAWGALLSEADLADLVAFVMAVREHDLPQPSDVWELDASAPKGYVLKPGARVAAGHTAIESRCTGCHGNDGTTLLFDDGELSLGMMGRSSAYEVWFKIALGNVGTPMRSQLPQNGSGIEKGQFVLDVLAALCDRSAYPVGAATGEDVPVSDPRCGDYVR